jgi:putative aminopeptidase FrvX
MSDLKQLLFQLSNAFGPSGFEGEVREIFRQATAGCAEIGHDNLGGIMAIRRGGSAQPKILLAAHLDEVGLMVRGILPSGYLKVVPLGGWWAPALVAQKVRIRTRTGDRFGVVGAKPPHFLGEDEKSRQLRLNDLYVDVGARSLQEAAALGIEPGDPIVPAVEAVDLNPAGMVLGKALDDRVGCAAVIQALRELPSGHPNTVIGSGTVQEENGIKGARTITALARPDLALVLEGPPADDFPDAGGIIQGRPGAGPQIRRFDPSMIANPALADLAVAQAKKLGIPYQVTVREGGGTDGREIQLEAAGGVPTLVIGVPVRYAHSHHGLVDLRDLEATVALVKALIGVLDEPTVAALKREPWEQRG